MHIDILYQPVREANYKHQTVVVLDILRASTTIITALQNGARFIRAVKTVQEARAAADASPNVLLGGERGGLKPAGFSLGNSPLEYTPENSAGKGIVFTTTNGTRAIESAAGAETVYIGAFINLQAVVQRISEEGRDITFLCAGNENRFSFEDALCAALMVYNLVRSVSNPDLSDSARWSLYSIMALVQEAGELSTSRIHTLLQSSQHGKRLLNLGFDDDLRYCAALNSLDNLPCLTEDKLII